jgi:hypothetical protein
MGTQGDDESLAASSSSVRYVIVWFAVIWAYEITFWYSSRVGD